MAPHTNMIIIRMKGLTEPTIARQGLSCSGPGRSSSDCRRYFTVNQMITAEMRTVKNTETAFRKKNSESIFSAKSELARWELTFMGRKGARVRSGVGRRG